MNKEGVIQDDTWWGIKINSICNCEHRGPSDEYCRGPYIDKVIDKAILCQKIAWANTGCQTRMRMGLCCIWTENGIQ